MRDWKNEIRRRLMDLRIAPAREASMVEELAQHLEDRYEELLASGVDKDAAYGLVLTELENADLLSGALRRRDRAPAFEPVPAAAFPSGNGLSDLGRDLRYAFRSMRKTPAFFFFAVLTLALGIGATTTVFTIVNTLLLHPLPAKNPAELACIYTTQLRNAQQARSLLPVSYLNLQDYAARNAVFSSIAGFTGPELMTLTGSATPQTVFVELVTARYFDTLGLAPAKGRFFLASEEGTPGSAPVAVISHAAWKIRFGGAPDILGRAIEINRVAFTVVGVAPERFIGVSAVFGPEVWLPATMAEQVLAMEMRDALRERKRPLFQGLARLRPSVTRKQAEDNLRSIAAALAHEYPHADEDQTVTVRPITDELFGSVGGEKPVLFGSAVLLAVVGLVLLIASANVANLLLARAAMRRQEISVRLAIGASRSRLVRQLLTESLLLGLIAGVVGLAFGYQGSRLVWSFYPPEVAQNVVQARFDSGVFLCALLLSLATSLMFGMVPALRSARADIVEALKEETRTAGRSRKTASFGNALLVGQVALSLLSLVTAALFLRSIQRAYQIDPGFDVRHLVVLMLNPGQAGYNQERTKNFYREVRDRLSTRPGVTSVSWASNMPFWAWPSSAIVMEGEEQKKASERLMSVVDTVDVDFFSTMHTGFLDGRDFSEYDDEGARPVAIVNETLARKYWPRGDALGHRVRFSGDTVSRQIVGIVKTTNYTSLGEAPQPCVYLPLRQNFSESMILYVRTHDPTSLLPAVEREIARIDPQIGVSYVFSRTGSKIISQLLWSANIAVRLLSAFGLLALGLASVGLYGVMAYSVNRRQREIGVRMALGAARWSVLGMVVRQGMSLVLIGVAAGLGAALLIGRALSSMLYGISPADPISLAGASLVLMAVALIACYLPGRAASRLDPLTALRES